MSANQVEYAHRLENRAPEDDFSQIARPRARSWLSNSRTAVSEYRVSFDATQMTKQLQDSAQVFEQIHGVRSVFDGHAGSKYGASRKLNPYFTEEQYRDEAKQLHDALAYVYHKLPAYSGLKARHHIAPQHNNNSNRSSTQLILGGGGGRRRNLPVGAAASSRRRSPRESKSPSPHTTRRRRRRSSSRSPSKSKSPSPTSTQQQRRQQQQQQQPQQQPSSSSARSPSPLGSSGVTMSRYMHSSSRSPSPTPVLLARRPSISISRSTTKGSLVPVVSAQVRQAAHASLARKMSEKQMMAAAEAGGNNNTNSNSDSINQNITSNNGSDHGHSASASASAAIDSSYSDIEDNNAAEFDDGGGGGGGDLNKKEEGRTIFETDRGVVRDGVDGGDAGGEGGEGDGDDADERYDDDDDYYDDDDRPPSPIGMMTSGGHGNTDGDADDTIRVPSWADDQIAFYRQTAAASHDAETGSPVSYTHLTLPTIYSV